MKIELTLLQRFDMARTKLNHSFTKAASELLLNSKTDKPYSDRYIYEVLNYPSKNPELFASIREYCEGAESIPFTHSKTA